MKTVATILIKDNATIKQYQLPEESEIHSKYELKKNKLLRK